MFLTQKSLESIEGFLKKIESRLTRIEEKIEIGNNNLNLFTNDTKKEIKTLSEKIDCINHEFYGLNEKYKAQIEDTKELNNTLRKRIDSFRILEDTAQKRLFSETKSEIREKLDSLMHTTKEYRKLENGLKNIGENIIILSSEIEKFKNISSQIKKEDFNLAKFAREVVKEDAEKLRLIRENEKLKMLISKERRNRQNHQPIR